MAEAKDNIPDKETYQVNRRRMCWVVLVMMAAMTVAIIGWPERYQNANVMEMAYLALSINPNSKKLNKKLWDKHFFRKNGNDAYYGQQKLD